MDYKTVLEIVVPILAAMGWMWRHLIAELKENNKEMRELNTRVSRIEGFLMGPCESQPHINEQKRHKKHKH